MQDFTTLRVWQHAHQFRLSVYRFTRSFPHEERFGITSQLNRSAASIAANIAESCGYRGEADSARFLQIALGSCCETLNHLMVARDLNFLSMERFQEAESALASIRRMLLMFLKRIRSRQKR